MREAHGIWLRSSRRLPLLAVFVLSVSAPGLVMLTSVAFASRPEPVETRLQTISLTTRAVRAESKALPQLHGTATGDRHQPGDSHEPVVLTGEIDTAPFRLIAATWTSTNSDVVARARSRSAGRWSQWYELPQGDSHAPDPGSAEANAARAGTDPLFVAESDAVQVQVDTVEGTMPDDLRLDLIDPGKSPADVSIGALSGSDHGCQPTHDLYPGTVGGRRVHPWGTRVWRGQRGVRPSHGQC